MNKLAWLVITVLVLLGAAMWYLANVSFQDYFRQQLITRTADYLGSDLTVETIDAKSNHLGRISGLTLTDKKTQTVWLKVAAIEYQLNKKSFKKPPVIIENIHFSGVELTNPALASAIQANIVSTTAHLGLNMEIASVSYTKVGDSEEVTTIEFKPNQISETESQDIWQQALAELISSLIE